MNRLGFKTDVYEGDMRLGELDVFPITTFQNFRFPNNEIRIHHRTLRSERCPPLSILQTISPFFVRRKLDSSLAVEQPHLINLHASCFHEMKGRGVAAQICAVLGWSFLTVVLVESQHAGTAIPEMVRFGGTFRSFTLEDNPVFRRELKSNQIIEMQAAVHQCTATVDFMVDRIIPYPPTVTDEALYEHAKRVEEALLGKTNLKFSPLITAAEDFSFYTQKMAASFFVTEIYNETLKSVIETHSPYFVIDEEVLSIGAAFHAAVAMSYFDTELPSLHECQ